MSSWTGGNPSVIILTIGPTIAVLLGRGDNMGAALMLVLPVAVIFLTSTISCPSCRQQKVCTLGRLTSTSISSKNL